MEPIKKMGIWLDYSSANLVDPDNETNLIISSKSSQAIEEKVFRGEKRLHNKEQQMQENYFKEIADNIKDSDHLLLFGPTNAKVELHSYLSEKTNLKNVKVDVQSADKMTDNEKNAFVKKHFMDPTEVGHKEIG